MTELLDEPPAEKGMSPQERDLADRIYGAIQAYTTNTERGQQAKEFRVGVSDLGYCSERTRRMLDQQVPEDSDMLLAFIGTALGDHVEQAVETRFDTEVIRQAEVTLTLRGPERTYEVMGHPDLILPTEGVVLDVKTSYGLALARRLGADQQKRFQRHGYAKAAWDAGLFGDLPLEDVQVGNVWLDRAGKAREVHVELEPFDPTVLDDAVVWLEGVIQAYVNGVEALKEPPREVCAATCGFFTVCRAFDTDVSGLITDPTALTAVEMYQEGQALEKKGRALKSEAKPALDGISGSTGTHTVRWIHVNEVTVAESKRAAHSRLDIRKIR